MTTRLDARMEQLEGIEFFGIPMLYSMFRLDRTTIPKYLYVYEVRHSDYDDTVPLEIKKDILVYFWGTLISSRPLPMNEQNCCYIRPCDDWGFTGEKSMLIDYMAEHPPLVKKAAPER